MRTRPLATLVLVLLGGLLTAVAGAGTGSWRYEPVLGLQPVTAGEKASYNWAGYAVYKTDMTFKDVSGSWTQPEVQGTCPKKTQLAAFYVGIDGYNSNSVEQIGTDADCQFGAPLYYAWYEMYPAPVVYLSTETYPVAPGDGLTAEVEYNSSASFTLTLDNDNGSGEHSPWGYTTTVDAPVTPARTSAQWIAEMPGTGGHFWPLSNFGNVAFTGASVTNDASHTGDIDDTTWNNDRIDLVQRGRGTALACTGDLTGGGSSFTVTYGSC